MLRRRNAPLKRPERTLVKSPEAMVQKWIERNPDVELVLEIAERARVIASFDPAISLDMAQEFALNGTISQLPAR